MPNIIKFRINPFGAMVIKINIEKIKYTKRRGLKPGFH